MDLVNVHVVWRILDNGRQSVAVWSRLMQAQNPQTSSRRACSDVAWATECMGAVADIYPAQMISELIDGDQRAGVVGCGGRGQEGEQCHCLEGQAVTCRGDGTDRCFLWDRVPANVNIEPSRKTQRLFLPSSPLFSRIMQQSRK
jgi:hypothetical protein